MEPPFFFHQDLEFVLVRFPLPLFSSRSLLMGLGLFPHTISESCCLGGLITPFFSCCILAQCVEPSASLSFQTYLMIHYQALRGGVAHYRGSRNVPFFPCDGDDEIWAVWPSLPRLPNSWERVLLAFDLRCSSVRQDMVVCLFPPFEKVSRPSVCSPFFSSTSILTKESEVPG